jgi:hypothetical protein
LSGERLRGKERCRDLSHFPEVTIQGPSPALAEVSAPADVAIAHTKLTSKADADRMNRYWSERLDALGEWLSRSPRGSTKS